MVLFHSSIGVNIYALKGPLGLYLVQHIFFYLVYTDTFLSNLHTDLHICTFPHGPLTSVKIGVEGVRLKYKYEMK